MASSVLSQFVDVQIIEPHCTTKLKWNKCSVLHLKDCSELTKLDSEVSLSQENFHFPRSGLSSQGRRPRLDSQTEAGQSRSRKM